MQSLDRRTIATSIADNYESHDVARATRRRLAGHVRTLRDACAVVGEQEGGSAEESDDEDDE
jgi:hypothetical protein